MIHNETYRSDLEGLICDIKISIEILKKVPEALSGKNYLYPDDPEHKQIFENCQRERPIITEELEELKRRAVSHADVAQSLVEIAQELEKSLDGFFLMISETEVEQSVVEYHKDVELVFEKLCKTVTCMK